MAEIKQIRDAMKKRKRARTVRRIAVFVILLSLVVVIIINKDALSPQSLSNWLSGSVTQGGEEGFPVQLPSGETINFENVESNLALTNQTNIYFYSARGKELRGVQHSRKNVQSKIAGDNVLVYSVGGVDVSVETHLKTAATLKTEKNIITGEVAKNGKFVIATQSDVYTSEMTVYDKNANAIFKWTPSVGVISTLAISQDGSRVAAATLYAQGGRIMSGIYLFSTSKSEALFSYQLENELVRALSCDRNGVSVVGDTQFLNLSADSKEEGSFSYDEKQLVDFASCSKGLAMIFQDVNDPNRSVLCIVSDQGELKAEANVPYKISDIDCSGNGVYLLSENKVLLYDASTAMKKEEVEIEDDALRLCATSAGAYVITAASELINPNIG